MFTYDLNEGAKMKRIIAVLYALCVVLSGADTPAQEVSPSHQMMMSKDQLIKNEVETALSMLEAIEMKHRRGEMTLQAAKKLGADLLRELRYGDGGYFWADTLEGLNIVLYGRKDVEGKNRLEEKDADGVYYLKVAIAAAKAGGGYLEYHYPKKGGDKPHSKRSYVKLFKPFGWVVGTGYYLE
jgi:methyl-accepting chemotaxis protein